MREWYHYIYEKTSDKDENMNMSSVLCVCVCVCETKRYRFVSKWQSEIYGNLILVETRETSNSKLQTLDSKL